MVVIWGQRMYGRVDRFAGSYVGTRFFHLYYVPLIPLSSWLVLDEQADGRFVGLQVPLQLRSVLLAWVRIASAIAVLGSLGAAISAGDAARAGHYGTYVGAAIYIVAAIALALLAWGRLGKLTREEKAERVVYADYAGRFVDVGLLGDGRDAIHRKVVEEVDRHLVKHALSGYRDAPQRAWREIATRPDQRDVGLLRAALTRARIEWSHARGDDKRALSQDHGRIFANLVKAAPELIAVGQVEQYELKG